MCHKWPLARFHSITSSVHTLLYALLLAMPIVGYTATSAFGAPTPFFGLFDLPPIVGKNEALSKQLFMLHRWTGYAVAALALLHIGAALQHYFIRTDAAGRDGRSFTRLQLVGFGNGAWLPSLA